MKQLLIADDDARIRLLLNHYLTREGFRVIEAHNGEQAMQLMQEQQMDLAILDVNMPDIDGLQVCRHIRSNYDIPIILLTAHHGIEDKEQGYLSGTDDYVTKPFELPELLFRIRALFRRYSIASSDKIKINSLIIDRQNHEVIDGESVQLLPLKEFELLAQLAQYPSRLFTRDELITLIWGADYSGDERTVDVHIKRLRKRFNRYEQSFKITTVRGLGYKLEVYDK